MTKVYGITTCGSVKSAMKFLKDRSIAFEFVDLKKVAVSAEQLESWIDDAGLDLLFNKKGTKYRSLNLKDLTLSDEDKKLWLLKEQLLFKRPIIEHNGKVIVGFDEVTYSAIFK